MNNKTKPPLLQTPVLLLIFNRVNEVRRVFESLRESRPPRLFIAADGPRSNIPSDKDDCKHARQAVSHIDWDCEVHTLFRDENLGCRRAVSSALDWFFDIVDEGIILEDDCLPNRDFYAFCEDLLSRYRDDSRIWVISGDNFLDNRIAVRDSYYFSAFPHCWGWATWKNRWKYFDRTMAIWPRAKEERWLKNIWPEPLYQFYWQNIFDQVYSEQIDSWAYIWTFCVWMQSGLTALPSTNLVRNIGLGSHATHTRQYRRQEWGHLESPLRHPETIIRNTVADRYTMRHHFNVSLRKELKKLLKEKSFANIRKFSQVLL